MYLDDSGFAIFSYEVGTAAAGFLAISAAVWFFLFDRRAQDEEDALGRAGRAGSALYNFLVEHANDAQNYVHRNPEDYLKLIHDVVLIGRPESSNVPRYVEWREHTLGTMRASDEQEKALAPAKERALTGGPWREEDQAANAFQTRFLDLMNDTDLAVQRLDWIRGVSRAGKAATSKMFVIAIVLLLVGLGGGLAASVGSVAPIADGFNLYLALLLLLLVFLLVSVLTKAFLVTTISRRDWIEQIFRQEARKRRLNPDRVREDAGLTLE